MQRATHAVRNLVLGTLYGHFEDLSGFIVWHSFEKHILALKQYFPYSEQASVVGYSLS